MGNLRVRLKVSDSHAFRDLISVIDRLKYRDER